MKLWPLPKALSSILPASAANCSRRHCRTLSVNAKKPASVAGFLSFSCDFPRLLTHSLPDRQASRTSPLLKLTTQTPSSL
jgi:hypothetical protein